MGPRTCRTVFRTYSWIRSRPTCRCRSDSGARSVHHRTRLSSSASWTKSPLELAATKAGWGTPLPPGRGRGIAIAEWEPTTCAEVAEVSVASDGTVRVHRVVCAVDCGQVVNPDTLEAQMQGGVVFGLSATLYGEITIANGRVKQGNFTDYPVLRIPEMPVVEVYTVPSTDTLGGIGEPSVPPTAPAVCNAIFAATGKRIRSLPIGKVSA